jgi:hypothetical protein
MVIASTAEARVKQSANADAAQLLHKARAYQAVKVEYLPESTPQAYRLQRYKRGKLQFVGRREMSVWIRVLDVLRKQHLESHNRMLEQPN